MSGAAGAASDMECRPRACAGVRRRVMLTVAYDGTDYSGYALQKTSPKPTIEGEINHAIHALTGETVQVIGASRTDAGVHALGNVAVFDTASPIPAENMAHALNPLLPRQIRIIAAREVRSDFHPRHTKTLKTYEYHILNAPYDIPTMSRYTHRVPWPLDVARMQEGAEYLVGEHDFTSFCNVQTQSENHVRNIEKILMKKQLLADMNDAEGPSLIVLQITGNGFLYNMVRIIAGTLIQVGARRREVGDVAAMLDARDRSAAGPTAPPEGLILKKIIFEELS